jgi:hypothetical protein
LEEIVSIGSLALTVSLAVVRFEPGYREPSANDQGRWADVAIYVNEADSSFGWTRMLVTSMLGEAGVEVAWLKRPRPSMEHGLIIRVLFDRADLTPNQFVLARAYPFSGNPRIVTVFINRIRAISHAVRIDEYKLLAHVLTHEVAHLLEGAEHHSESGIMKQYWTKADCNAMAVRPLSFMREDIEWMQRALTQLRAARMSRR